MSAKADWKARQDCYHQSLDGELPDELSTVPHEVRECAPVEQIVADVVAYMQEEQPICYFPAKTFAVALLYAKLLEKHLAVPMFEALADPELLYGNMRDFEPYPDERGIYVQALMQLDLDAVLANPPSQAAATISFFKQEFFIDQTLGAKP